MQDNSTENNSKSVFDLNKIRKQHMWDDQNFWISNEAYKLLCPMKHNTHDVSRILDDSNSKHKSLLIIQR